MNQTTAAHPPRIQLPGCKSLSQRALILAAGGAGRCELRGLSECDDSRFLLQALQDLGVQVAMPGPVLRGLGGPPQGNGQVVDVGEAGSSLRFLLPWCSAGRGTFVLTGAPRLFERPHDDLIEFLTERGAVIQPVDVAGRPGLRIDANGLPAGDWRPPVLHSSQYASGIAMAAEWTAPLDLQVPEDLPSRGYFELTLEAMREFAINDPLQRGDVGNRSSSAANENTTGRCNPNHYDVAGDPSGATFFLVATVLLGDRLSNGMLLGPAWSMTHPEAQLLLWFEESGLLKRDGEHWTLTGNKPQSNSIHLDPAPDAGPALAVLGAFLPGGLTLHGVERLRIKESDRVAGIQRLLQLLGARGEVIGDALQITSSTLAAANPNAIPAASYHPDGDHRLAMAAGIARLRVPQLQIEQPECVAKSFPSFWEQLSKLEA